MTGGASERFSSPEDYEAGLGQIAAAMAMPQCRGFTARLTTATLPSMKLLCAQESLPRVAHLALPPRYVCISLSLQSPSRLINNGIDLEPGELLFHRSAARAHQRTTGAVSWSVLMLAKGALPDALLAGVGQRRGSPPIDRIVRPRPKDYRRLVRLLGRIGRRAEARPVSVTQPLVASDMEREVFHTLVSCLDTGEVYPESPTTRQHAEIMDRFEVALTRNLLPLLRMPELCAIAGVQERTLRTCCATFLGLSPGQYLRLRRMKLVRAEIQAADDGKPHVGEIARRFGFTEVGRFAASYRSVFGEAPSVTQRHAQLRFKSGETSKNA